MGGLFEATEKLDKKVIPGFIVPVNVLRRMLKNVYFIWGSNEGIAVADELGRRYGLYVYHTCDHRQKHSENADPILQPGLCTFKQQDNSFWTQPPEEAMQREQSIVSDYTPMVIMDLIKLSGSYDGVICENDIDIESIIQYVSHAVRISYRGTQDNSFFDWYESKIRERSDISQDEKESYIRGVKPAIDKVKGEIPGETTLYGVKHIIWNDNSTLQQAADEIAEHFGLASA